MKFKDGYHTRVCKFIATQEPNKVKVDGIAAKSCATKLCNCPNSEPGKISADLAAHLPGCRIRERLKSGRYTVNTSVTPQKFNDGCNLGVVLGD